MLISIEEVVEVLSVNKEYFLWMNFGIFIVLLMYIFHFYIDYFRMIYWSILGLASCIKQ